VNDDLIIERRMMISAGAVGERRDSGIDSLDSPGIGADIYIGLRIF